MSKAIALIVVIGVALFSWSAIRAQRARAAAQDAMMQAQKIQQEVQALKLEMESQPESPESLEAEIEELKNEQRTLHKLRGEIQQLRSQTNQLAALREENAQLKNALSSLESAGSVDLQTMGFVPESSWRHAGHNTREDAITTFFHLLRNGDLENLVAGTHPDLLEGNPLESMPEERRTQVKESMQTFFSQIKAYRIVQWDEATEDTATAQVATSLNSELFPVKLQQHEGQWKFAMEDQFF